MLLRDIIANTGCTVTGPDSIDVVALTLDSRKAAPRTLFAALPGSRADGAMFIPEALGSGACAILTSQPAPVNLAAGVTWICAREPRQVLARMAARFYIPQPETLVAVTGTSGKTSVVSFTRQLFTRCGFNAASLGTLGAVTSTGQTYGTLTTPDPIALHWLLKELAEGHVTHVALEASSHGLDQHRLDGVRLSAAAFTNLTRDHLDYHASMDEYCAAKLRLVRELLPDGAPFVAYANSPYADAFIAAAQQRRLPLITVGEGGSTLELLRRERLPQGQRLSLHGSWGRAEVLLPLIGDFQASNALVAAGLVHACGQPLSKILPALEALTGVRGRMDKVGDCNGAGVYVDYAHKPDALAKLLDAMRPYTKNRLIVVFGCGGDRDPGKRPVMGSIAAEKADVVIVTDDNPRHEEAHLIRAAIREGAPDATEIGDRATAIAASLSMAQPGDVVVIAGKGHETGQIIGAETRPFSDHDTVARLLGKKAA